MTTIKKAMRGAAKTLAAISTLSILGFAPFANAAGLLSPVNSATPPLEIRSHDVDVVVQDGYVITEVEQVFHNPNSQDMEALYTFPIPEKALVSSFTVWIDGQPVVGEVVEKERARQIYEQEKQAGREAGLTEQNSYKRFEVKVTPVRAMSDTRIALQYMQTTDIDTGIGRYVYPLEEGGTDEEKLSFWTANEVVTERFSYRMRLRSAYPIDAVRLPNTSDASVKQLASGEWEIEILRNGQGAQTNASNPVNEDEVVLSTSANGTVTAATEVNTELEIPSTRQDSPTATTLDQDLVVYWRMAQNLPGSLDLTAYREPGANKGTFMMVMSPGVDLAPIQQGRDWMFVLDISGSMQGKFSTLVDGVNRSLKKMPANDRFRVVVFNKRAKEITNGWTIVNEDNIRHYNNQIANIRPGEGTNLFDGIKAGLTKLDADRTTGVVLVTDGVANVGETMTHKFLKLIKQQDVRLFTFILGNEANRPLLESLAQHSNGFAINVSNNDDIVGKIMEATQKINHQAMNNVRVKISGVKTSDVSPEKFGTIYRGEQLIVTGRYWHSGEVLVDLEAEISGQPVQYSTRFQLPEVATDNPELERIWAFANIQAIKDQNDLLGEDADRKQAITDLAIEHGIVTEGTSMIVLREEQFAAHNIERRNKQRVAKEQAAQQQRASQPVQQRRVDNSAGNSQPMFNQPRPSYSGGGSGSFDMIWLALLLPMLAGVLRGRRNDQR